MFSRVREREERMFCEIENVFQWREIMFCGDERENVLLACVLREGRRGAGEPAEDVAVGLSGPGRPAGPDGPGGPGGPGLRREDLGPTEAAPAW